MQTLTTDNIKNTSTEILEQKLKDRENYWIKRLKFLTLKTTCPLREGSRPKLLGFINYKI